MTSKDDALYSQRVKMVEEQIVARGITDSRLTEAMLAIPRHLFVPFEFREESYLDKALPLGPEQTISQPYIVAFMLASLELASSHRVLEVGSGSGYLACVASLLVESVVAIDLSAELIQSSSAIAKELHRENITFLCRDGLSGYREGMPYDRIIVSAASAEIPRELLRQLAPSGKIIFPMIDEDDDQELILLSKEGDNLREEVLGSVRFVLLKGNS